MLKSTLLILIVCSTLASCYRMPGEDDFSVIPATNNPSVTREKPQDGLQALQGGSF
jgi:hypothetical protein